jgi:hypothetical protein
LIEKRLDETILNQFDQFYNWASTRAIKNSNSGEEFHDALNNESSFLNDSSDEEFFSLI